MGAFLSVADNLSAREVVLDIPIVPDPTLDTASGGLFLEMDHSAHVRAMLYELLYIDPESNIFHQEEVHRSVRTWLCIDL